MRREAGLERGLQVIHGARDAQRLPAPSGPDRSRALRCRRAAGRASARRSVPASAWRPRRSICPGAGRRGDGCGRPGRLDALAAHDDDPAVVHGFAVEDARGPQHDAGPVQRAAAASLRARCERETQNDDDGRIPDRRRSHGGLKHRDCAFTSRLSAPRPGRLQLEAFRGASPGPPSACRLTAGSLHGLDRCPPRRRVGRRLCAEPSP